MTPAPSSSLTELLARAADPEGFEAWRARGKATGWCRHPVRLTGSTRRVDVGTGEVRGEFASAALPDSVLLKACQQRRATVCPSCSATYRSDAFQLVSAGLRGGKGVPESVAEHPAVFVTLTAPSFGAVHSAPRNDLGQVRACRPTGGAGCGHGVRGCAEVHRPDEPLLGQPICAQCFEYRSAVVWNALVGELWRRTTIGLRRSLAHQIGVPASRLAEVTTVSFAKVVEYQRRGVVHLHAVIRLDPSGVGAVPITSAELIVTVLEAARAATVSYPESAGLVGRVRWGDQLDAQVVGRHGIGSGGAAGYLAKYATKSTDPTGLLDRRLRAGDLDHLDGVLSAHLARMVRTAWDLGGRPELAHLRLRAWAHTLGFRGHWLTKSRAYSTTFTALRSARQEWHTRDDAHRHDGGQTTAVGEWRYVGRGWTTPADAWLAETAAEELGRVRRVAKEERRGVTAAAGEQRA